MTADTRDDGAQDLVWRKSTHSGPNGGDCVEVAGTPDAVHVRDSKDPRRPALRHGRTAWRVFLDGLGA